MRKVKFESPNDDPEWDKWVEKARRARSKLFRVFEAFASAGAAAKFKPDIDNDTYKGCRDYILRAFHGKCAYCESAIIPVMVHGDVEHYRPKLLVKTYRYEKTRARPYIIKREEPQIIRDLRAASEALLAGFDDLPPNEYRGYFWLAYSLENLLPSCIACNRYEKENFFPARGMRLSYRDSHDAVSEHRMLVNPYIDDPEEHFAFDDGLTTDEPDYVDRGYVRPLSLEGAISIEVYGLNRERLPEMRATVMRQARLEFNRWWAALLERDDEQVAASWAILERYVIGTEPYSAAALTAIGKIEQRLHERGLVLPQPIGIWPTRQRSKLN